MACNFVRFMYVLIYKLVCNPPPSLSKKNLNTCLIGNSYLQFKKIVVDDGKFPCQIVINFKDFLFYDMPPSSFCVIINREFNSHPQK